MAIYPWQDELWHQLFNARQKLPHALLMQGRKGVGKLDFARALAQGLLCESPHVSGHGCGECLACNWIAQGNHPDFRCMEPEALTDTGEAGENKGKKASRQIRIEQVRELEGLINLSAHRNGMRVIIVHPAEAMNINAANALLKTLEEPPANTLFILITHQPQYLLPTVRSRCRKISFPVPPLEQSLSWLREQGVTDPAPFLAQAGYAPLVALEMVSDELQETRRGFLSQLSRPHTLDPIAMAEKSEKIDLVNVVKWLQQWMYDLIGYHFSGMIRYQGDFSKEISELSCIIKVDEALVYQKDLLEAQKNVHHPLNAQLLMEQLLLSYMQLIKLNESGHG